MAKQQATSSHVSKSKKRGKHSKSASSNKASKNYKKDRIRKSRAMTKNFTLAELTQTKTGLPNALTESLLRETFVRLQKTSYSQRETH
jgi:hypothetical protein